MKKVLKRLVQVIAVLLMASSLYIQTMYFPEPEEEYIDPSHFMAEILEKNGPEAWEYFADDSQLILENSSGRFIGYYPIDDNFLAYVAATYGMKGFNSISHGPKTNPEQWFKYTGKSIHVLWYDYCQLTGLKITEQNRVKVVEQKTKSSGQEEGEYVFAITGDITLSDSVATTIYMDQQINGITDCFSSELVDYMNNADVMIVNNEFTFTDRGTPLPGKSFTFRANPSRIISYDALGIDLVSLANNHVYDYGEVGLVDTLQTLNDHNLPYVGAGYNLKEAMQPYYYICGGRKVAVVSATQIERTLHFTRQATDEKPGVLKTLNEELFVSEISEAAKHSDMVIAIVHWGTEGNQIYGNDQQKLAKAFAFAGANIIVGGHTHCLQSIEYIGTVPVYYSLGNFYFSSTSSMPADYDTGIAEIRIKQDKTMEAYFVPCVFKGGSISLAKESKADERILKNLDKRSVSSWVDHDTGQISAR